MKKIFFIIFSLFSFFAFLKFFPSSVYAVTEVSGDLEVVYDSPLFDPATIWYPGFSETNDFTVKNIGSKTHTTYIQAENTFETGNLSTAMFFKVNQGGSVLYGDSESKTIKNFWNDGQISLSSVNNSQSIVYSPTISFWQGAGNEFQEKNTKFDLVIGFEGTDDKVVITVTTGDDEGDGGTGGGESSPAPTTLSSFVFDDLGAFVGGGIVDEEESPSPSPEVRGAEEGEGEVKGETVCSWWSYLWWLPLLIQACLIWLYYYWFKDKQAAVWWGMPLALSGLSQIIHEILGCECIQSSLCSWYWLFNLIILFSLTFYYYKRWRKHSSDLLED